MTVVFLRLILVLTVVFKVPSESTDELGSFGPDVLHKVWDKAIMKG